MNDFEKAREAYERAQKLSGAWKVLSVSYVPGLRPPVTAYAVIEHVESGTRSQISSAGFEFVTYLTTGDELDAKFLEDKKPKLAPPTAASVVRVISVTDYLSLAPRFVHLA